MMPSAVDTTAKLEVMQYEPQSVTFQLREVYLLLWMIAIGWKVVHCT